MDQYYIIKILGRGSEGQVLLAEHKTTHEEVAIKRMLWESLDEANRHLNEVIIVLTISPTDSLGKQTETTQS